MHSITPRRAAMHLALQNAETINRLVEQGELLLKTFYVEHEKDPAGWNTDFVRGELMGWRRTLHTLYHDYAERHRYPRCRQDTLDHSRRRSPERCRSWLLKPS